jgi:hypothetical protein
MQRTLTVCAQLPLQLWLPREYALFGVAQISREIDLIFSALSLQIFGLAEKNNLLITFY